MESELSLLFIQSQYLLLFFIPIHLPLLKESYTLTLWLLEISFDYLLLQIYNKLVVLLPIITQLLTKSLNLFRVEARWILLFLIHLSYSLFIIFWERNFTVLESLNLQPKRCNEISLKLYNNYYLSVSFSFMSWFSAYLRLEGGFYDIIILGCYFSSSAFEFHYILEQRMFLIWGSFSFLVTLSLPIDLGFWLLLKNSTSAYFKSIDLFLIYLRQL